MTKLIIWSILSRFLEASELIMTQSQTIKGGTSKKLREMYRDSVMTKAIIFDLDDTLVNITEISQRAVKDVYAKNIDKKV